MWLTKCTAHIHPAPPQREEMEALLPFVLRALRKLPGGATAAAPLQPDGLSQLAAWAWAVGRTRSVDRPLSAFTPEAAALLPPGSTKLPVLMPYLDMANHAEPGEAPA